MVLPLTGLNSVSVSGMIPASGTTGALSGPWMIEEQDLTIQYVRVPSYNSLTWSHSLSSATRSVEAQWTFLQNLVVANYKRSYSTDYYATSGWTQPQTFEYLPASSDAYDNTYGTVGVSALGPAGNIITRDKWYFRRPWLASDTTINEACEGTSHYFGGRRYMDNNPNSPTAGTILEPAPVDGMTYFGEFIRFNPVSTSQHTFMNNLDYRLKGDHMYPIFGGGYNTSAETPLLIQNYVDTIGGKLAQLDFYGITGGGGLIQDPNYLILALRNTGCAGYSSVRHDWT